jgi:hypothetical protein
LRKGWACAFWTSYDTEDEWDFLFVEAARAGTNYWTTLPDANGHTTQNTGQSCLASNSGGWRTLHPWLVHYQTLRPARGTRRTPTPAGGSSGAST